VNLTHRPTLLLDPPPVEVTEDSDQALVAAVEELLQPQS
jgi:hypothetical protein